MFDRMPKIVGVMWPRPRPLLGKIICAPAWHYEVVCLLDILTPQWLTWPWTTSKQRSGHSFWYTNRFLIYDFL